MSQYVWTEKDLYALEDDSAAFKHCNQQIRYGLWDTAYRTCYASGNYAYCDLIPNSCVCSTGWNASPNKLICGNANVTVEARPLT